MLQGRKAQIPSCREEYIDVTKHGRAYSSALQMQHSRHGVETIAAPRRATQLCAKEVGAQPLAQCEQECDSVRSLHCMASGQLPS